MTSETSPNLALPYLMPAQAQKHVTHNEALQILDALVQLTIASFGASTPPAAPAPGEAHALGAAPGGAWAGHAQQIAIWQGEGWLFLAPRPGWRAWSAGGAGPRVWDGTAWAEPALAAQSLGVGAAADAVNRLALSSDAALFTHAGGGHHLKINKAGAGDTAALLFQSGWSGHAEMGLLGNQDFTVKLSADGSAWATALALTADGRAGLGTASPAAHLEIADGSQDYLRAGSGTPAFRLAADGNGYCAGAWSGGGADYAEWFEWADGNPQGEDRRGIAVVLAGNRIRPAEAGEDPVDVISARPAVVGGGDADGWQGRILRDAFGAPLPGPDGAPQENPAYDAKRAYVPRAARPEWDMVGLLGRLRLRAGQPAGRRWIRLREAAAETAEWLVR
ncbi:peptidase G2 autoproteolytic cleavage domain-containing protein (plasmid) [Roseobacteraceae bacterium NS-SX3]